jgi:hypothetical protein
LQWYRTFGCLDSLWLTLVRFCFFWSTSWVSRVLVIFRCFVDFLCFSWFFSCFSCYPDENSAWFSTFSHDFHQLQVLILSDLECDYINARQCCAKLNFWSWVAKYSTDSNWIEGFFGRCCF